MAASWPLAGGSTVEPGQMPVTGSFPLAQALREGTRELHAAVERSTLMQALLRGRFARPVYLLLLRNLHPIYEVLEAALARHAAHPGLAPLALAGLARAPQLAEDLCHLHGARWAQELPELAEARRYVERLAELEGQAPALLAAHAYVRYLGDLSGGQLLQGIVARTLGLAGEAGTRFYAFGAPGAAQVLAQRLRRSLDGVAADAQAAAACVAEARSAFVRHQRLFDEIAAAAA